MITADEALQKLMEGNQRYLAYQMKGQKLCDVATRQALTKGQSPYAIILCCSDSRVPPEIILTRVWARSLWSEWPETSPIPLFWEALNTPPNTSARRS